MGLRRGFVQAGAQNLLMTLWPISDEVTAQIMSDFYDAAHKSGNAPEALAETQRDWLVKLRTEKGLAEAVTLAGPFIMSSQGKDKRGVKQERVERKKVLALAQARKIDVILVTELTRWDGSARFAARSLACFKFRFVSSPHKWRGVSGPADSSPFNL